VEVAHHAAKHFRAEHLVIAADPEYHALGLYESLASNAPNASPACAGHRPIIEPTREAFSAASRIAN
jgi:hypothetical protein